MALTLYPAIDVRGGSAVRLTQGDYDRETAYDADPLDAARRWADGGAEILHVVDLDGARAGSPQNLETITRIVDGIGVPVQVGGGIRDEEAVEAVLAAGAARVVVGTRAQREPAFVGRLVERHGSERIVASVDGRGGKVAVEGWEQSTDTAVADLIRTLSKLGARRFVYTPVEVDGTLSGPGLEGLEPISAACRESGSELIYSGGVGVLEDLARLASIADSAIGGVIVGRALYEGRFGVADAIETLSGRQHPRTHRRPDRRDRMSVLGLAAKTGMKWTVWARVLILAEIALAIKRRLDLLDADEKRDLQELVKKSKGRPSNLTKRERQRMGALVSKIEPTALGKEVAEAAIPWRKSR